ncbi:AAA family ATPase [bacterium]|nr:AAA family ATPase [bacterium]
MSKIRVKNFKSFKDLEVELGNFNVLIGANASGKSNFVEIFRFLKDVLTHGLENAISLQGDVKYLRNISLGAMEDLVIEIVSPMEVIGVGRPSESKGERLGAKTYETTYKFTLGFGERKKKYELLEESFLCKCKLVRLMEEKDRLRKVEVMGEGRIMLSREAKGKLEVKVEPPDFPFRREDIFYPFPSLERMPEKELLLRLASLILPTPIEGILEELAIYDFDPKLPKKAIPIAGKLELEEDGSNLALVLKNILEDKERREQLINLLNWLLPFVSRLGVEKFADKSLLVMLQEKYFKEYVPAPLISDGTINLIALIVALYFEKKRFIIIEEPERNIHPYLISKVVEMMKEASGRKQIIITTHNPEIVRHSGLENLLLISRDEQGFSNISRPADKEGVKTFLEHEIGLDELYVQDLLGV